MAGRRKRRTPFGAGFTALAAKPPSGVVTAINAKTGIVTARDTTSGKTFKFTVNDKAMLKGLKVGDAVQADFAAGQVAIQKYGGQPCCNIVP